MSKKKLMDRIIQKGIRSAPLVGCGGVFYPSMFVWSRTEWLIRLDAAKDSGLWERVQNGISHAPNDIYLPHVIRKDGYVYLYRVDAYGDLDSRAFTHEVIAGDSAK